MQLIAIHNSDRIFFLTYLIRLKKTIFRTFVSMDKKKVKLWVKNFSHQTWAHIRHSAKKKKKLPRCWFMYSLGKSISGIFINKIIRAHKQPKMNLCRCWYLEVFPFFCESAAGRHEVNIAGGKKKVARSQKSFCPSMLS